MAYPQGGIYPGWGKGSLKQIDLRKKRIKTFIGGKNMEDKKEEE